MHGHMDVKLQNTYPLPCCDKGNFRNLYPASVVTNFELEAFHPEVFVK